MCVVWLPLCMIISAPHLNGYCNGGGANALGAAGPIQRRRDSIARRLSLSGGGSPLIGGGAGGSAAAAGVQQQQEGASER